MKKKVLFAAAFMLATVGVYAQDNGIAGITETPRWQHRILTRVPS